MQAVYGFNLTDAVWGSSRPLTLRRAWALVTNLPAESATARALRRIEAERHSEKPAAYRRNSGNRKVTLAELAGGTTSSKGR
jgi:hypothetical protein